MCKTCMACWKYGTMCGNSIMVKKYCNNCQIFHTHASINRYRISCQHASTARPAARPPLLALNTEMSSSTPLSISDRPECLICMSSEKRPSHVLNRSASTLSAVLGEDWLPCRQKFHEHCSACLMWRASSASLPLQRLACSASSLLATSAGSLVPCQQELQGVLLSPLRHVCKAQGVQRPAGAAYTSSSLREPARRPCRKPAPEPAGAAGSAAWRAQ